MYIQAFYRFIFEQFFCLYLTSITLLTNVAELHFGKDEQCEWFIILRCAV